MLDNVSIGFLIRLLFHKCSTRSPGATGPKSAPSNSHISCRDPSQLVMKETSRCRRLKILALACASQASVSPVLPGSDELSPVALRVQVLKQKVPAQDPNHGS